MIRDAFARDPGKALAELAKLGVSSVELAGIGAVAPLHLSNLLAAAGIRADSAHVLLLHMTEDELDAALERYGAIGVGHLVAPSPALPQLVRQDIPLMNRATQSHQDALSADEWKWNADRLNSIGQKVANAGMRLAYHNHRIEFIEVESANAFELLISRTDPAQVAFELDIGHATLAGQDAAALLQRHAHRIELLHLKEWKSPSLLAEAPQQSASAPFGSGGIDWPSILAAAPASALWHMFIEQEGLDVGDAMLAVRQGLDYFRGLAS